MGKGFIFLVAKTMTRDGKMEFLILVSFNKPEQAMAYYKERWQV